MTNPDDKICIRAVVSGKVQGVFFRDSTLQIAKKLELTGWVKNTDEGDVELIACGNRDHIMELTDWLWHGPDAAEVSNVHWEEIETQKFEDFLVKK